MTRRRKLDRAAGKLYNRFIALIAGTASVAMFIAALVSWRLGGPVGGLVWLSGAVVFGVIARRSWSSRATLSDIDFTS